MQFSYYRIIYLNIILILCFFANQFFLFFLFIFFKLPYFLNLESDIEYEFDFIYSAFDDIDARYLENDIDNEYYYILTHMEIYLYNNCRFFFDILGGETTLDFVDFLDFTIYNINDEYIKINRNYKNIYNNKIAYINTKTMNDLYNYKIYQLIDNYINDTYLRTQINVLKTFFDNKKEEKEEYNNKKEIKKQMKKSIFMYDNKIIDKVKEQRRLKIFDILKKKF